MKQKAFKTEWLTAGVVFVFCILPVFFSLPFRVHIYLPFEGAYRFYLGQSPYQDFGMPFGYAFFLFPVLFFKVFGPGFISLVYAQVLINLISCFALFKILKRLRFENHIIFLSLLVYCLSYVFIHFWPWHTHTAFTFCLLSIWFFLEASSEKNKLKQFAWVFAASWGVFLSFFTKQDYGGLAFLFVAFLFVTDAIYQKRFLPAFFYVTFFIIILVFNIWAMPKEFAYWFNHGQAPHTSRLETMSFLQNIFGQSDWEKFYLLIIGIILLANLKNFKKFIADQQTVTTLIVVLGIIVMAMLTKVTSRMQTGTTMYFHAFALAYVFQQLSQHFQLEKRFNLIFTFVLICFWWSGMYWNYACRLLGLHEVTPPGVRISKYEQPKETKPWQLCEFKTLKKIKLPEETIEGIKRLKALPIFDGKSKPKVFNMTELTNLSAELGFEPLKGIPLWYDYGVCLFDQQIEEINQKVMAQEYDLFLFEHVPSMEDYYPLEVKAVLKQEYDLIDKFLAPRKEEDTFIEVYAKKKP